jgi:hypothetical protein
MLYVYIHHLIDQNTSKNGLIPSWSYGSWTYNYLCNHCLSPLKLWVRIEFMARCTRYNIKWLARRSMVFCGYSGILHQYNWSPRYNWNIVESGVKHHTPEQSVRSYDKVVYCLWSSVILDINNMCSLNFPNIYQIIYYKCDKRQTSKHAGLTAT